MSQHCSRFIEELGVSLSGFIFHVFNDVRGAPLALVGNRIDRGHHLQRGRQNALPIGEVGMVHPCPFFRRKQLAGRFTGESRTGFCSKAKLGDVVVKLCRRHLHADFRGTNIRRFLNDLPHLKVSVRSAVPDHPVGNLKPSLFTEELLRGRDDPLIQRGGHRDDLEGGAGFIAMRDCSVDLLCGIISSVTVGVEVRIVCQRKNLPGWGVQHNGHSGFALNALDALAQGAFCNMLEGGVQREVQGVLVELPTLIPDFRAGPEHAFLFHHIRDLFPVKPAVVAVLQAPQTLRINSSEAEQCPGEFSGGIIPPELRKKLQPVNLQFLNLLHLLRGELTLDPEEGGFGFQLGREFP